MDGLECSEIYLKTLERTLRIDAEFYKKGNLYFSAFLQKKVLQPFTKSFSISDGNHMSISESFCMEGIPYYRGQDIYSVFIEESSPVCIDRDTFLHPHMIRSHLKQNDVLMSIVGAIVGNSAIVSSNIEATCSCKLAIMRSKNEDISPQVLLAFIKTKYGQNQIQKFKRGAAQTGLLLEDFDQLFIPQFSRNFQQQIRDIIQSAHGAMTDGSKSYNEAQNFLLNQLHFDFDVMSTEGTSEKRLSESFGVSGRLDAEYYQPKYDQLFAALTAFETSTLGGSGGIADFQKSIEPGSESYGEEGIPFVRVSDITKFGISAPEIKLPVDIVEHPETLFPKKDSILFSKDGSVGIAYKLEKDAQFITSSALLQLTIRDTEKVLPDYLTLVLNSPVVQLQAERAASGAVIQHWKPSEIQQVIIPILDMTEQKELSKMVQESFSLRRQSEQLLDYAKQAVELAIEQGEDIAMVWLKDKVK
uniref:restriction endonuclease subunit S n=1 Tax=Enterocloster clostridioformis TaxID=1531 RepID=UPI0026F30330|nr:restriction endonuclease subunit S [Enterocloster clostridioformis]